MRKKKINGFTCFLMILISLTLFFFLRLTYEIQKEKQQYTILISLGNLSYDQNFLKKASKINGLQEIWPVVEIPVTIKIEDYTKTTVFCGIDLNAFTEISGQDNNLGTLHAYSWGAILWEIRGKAQWTCHFKETAE